LMVELVNEGHSRAAGELRSILATYRDNQDLINIGAYSKGSNPGIDKAISMIQTINDFLKQRVDEKVSYADTTSRLIEMIGAPVAHE
jgi:flagellum-specific ATP synthase